MMKRFASQYVCLPGRGFLKRYVVEMSGGQIVRLFPLTGEVENTEWLPGVIVLSPADVRVDDSLFDTPALLEEVPPELSGSLPTLIPYLCYPFDFTCMKPVGGTRHTQLR